MNALAERVYDSTDTEGTGTLALSGLAPATFFPFAGSVPDGSTVQFTVAHESLHEVEVAEGVYAAGTLTRERVLRSSNGGALVPFSPGNKSVILGWTAERATQAMKYTHSQDVPSAVWTVIHNLGCFPSVRVIDSGGNLVGGDVAYPDANTLVLSFAAPFGGVAHVN